MPPVYRRCLQINSTVPQHQRIDVPTYLALRCLPTWPGEGGLVLDELGHERQTFRGSTVAGVMARISSFWLDKFGPKYLWIISQGYNCWLGSEKSVLPTSASSGVLSLPSISTHLHHISSPALSCFRRLRNELFGSVPHRQRLHNPSTEASGL